MKVRELINKLSEMNPDAEAMVITSVGAYQSIFDCKEENTGLVTLGCSVSEDGSNPCISSVHSKLKKALKGLQFYADCNHIKKTIPEEMKSAMLADSSMTRCVEEIVDRGQHAANVIKEVNAIDTPHDWRVVGQMTSEYEPSLKYTSEICARCGMMRYSTEGTEVDYVK